MKKRILSLLVCCLMLSGVVTGCSSEKETTPIDDVQEEAVSSSNDIEVSAEPEEVVYTVSYAKLTGIMQNVYNGMDANRRKGGMGDFESYVIDNTTSVGTSEVTLSGISANVPIFSADDVEKINWFPRSKAYDSFNTTVQFICANFPDNLTYKEDKDIELEAIFLIDSSDHVVSEGHGELLPVRFAMNAADPSDWRIVPDTSDFREFNGYYHGFEYGVDENFRKVETSEIPFSQYYVSCFTDGFRYMYDYPNWYCVDNDNDPNHPYIIEDRDNVYEFNAEFGCMVKSDISNYSLNFSDELDDNFEGYYSAQDAVNAYKQGNIILTTSSWKDLYLDSIKEDVDLCLSYNLIDIDNNGIPELICGWDSHGNGKVGLNARNTESTTYEVYTIDSSNSAELIFEHDNLCIVDGLMCSAVKYNGFFVSSINENGYSDDIIFSNCMEYYNSDINDYDYRWELISQAAATTDYDEVLNEVNTELGFDILSLQPVDLPYSYDAIIDVINNY